MLDTPPFSPYNVLAPNSGGSKPKQKPKRKVETIMSNPNPLFAKIAAAKSMASGEYLPPDTRGLLLVTSTVIKTGFKGRSAIHDFRILKCEPKVEGLTNLPTPGTQKSWVLNFDKAGVAGEMALANSKDFMLACLGFKESEVKPEDIADTLEEVYGADQSLKGFVVAYDNIRSQKDPTKSFPRFSSVPGENTPEKVAQRRKELGG